MSTTDIDAAVEKLIANEPENLDDAEPREETVEEEAQDDAEVDAEAEAEVEAEDEVETEVETEDEAEGEEDPDVDEATEEGDDDEELPKYTVRVDGVDSEVTLDDLKRSYSGQAKIQQDMQANGETRNQLREAYQALEAERSRFLETVQQFNEQGVAAPPQKPQYDPNDPIGHMERLAQYEADLEAYQGQQAEVQRMSEQQKAFEQQRMQKQAQEQFELLQQRVPEYADEGSRAEFHNKVLSTLERDYGIPSAEVNQLMDARHIQVVADAARWRELQQSKEAAKTKPKPTKSVKPKGRQAPSETAKRKKKIAEARKTGSLESFVDLILE